MPRVTVDAAKSEFMEVVGKLAKDDLTDFSAWLDERLSEYKVTGEYCFDIGSRSEVPWWISKLVHNQVAQVVGLKARKRGWGTAPAGTGKRPRRTFGLDDDSDMEGLSDEGMYEEDRVRVVKKGGTYSCPECTAVFSNIGAYNSHMFAEHPEGQWEPPTSVSKVIFRHTGGPSGSEDWPEVKKTGEVDLVCPTCKDRQPSVNVLKAHMKEYHGHRGFAKQQGLFVCLFCAKKFTTPPSVWRHISSHHLGSCFYCGYCSEAFRRKEYAVGHCKSKHKDQPVNVVSKSAENDDVDDENIPSMDAV